MAILPAAVVVCWFSITDFRSRDQSLFQSAVGAQLVDGLCVLESAIGIIRVHLQFELDEVIGNDLTLAFNKSDRNGRFSSAGTLLLK